NEDILAEAATVLGRQLADPDNCFWVITVDVEDRAVKALSQVGGVVGRAGRIWSGGETNLVVDHNVYGTAGGVATQLRQVDGLLDNAQASERSIAVQHQRNNRVSVVALVQDVLLCASHTNQDWVYCFQVGWVSGQGGLDFAVTEHLQVLTGSTQVALHVSGAPSRAAVQGTDELSKQRRQRLGNEVAQDMQTSTVRHTDDNFIAALTRSGVNDGVHQRNQCFSALKREALLADVLGLQEVFECFCSVDLLQDVLLLSVGRLRHASFEAVAQPLALIAVEDVRVFGTNLEGVGRAQAREYLTQLHGLLATKSTNVERAIQIPDGQAMGFHIQVAVIWNRKSRLCPAQWVDVSNQVTAGAVGLDEGHDTGVLIDARVWNILCPAEWLVRNTHFLEDFIPELVI